MVVIKRALLSCYDKTGLDGFAKDLAELGVELIASGGTAEFLTKAGLRVKTVEEFTGVTEQLDGRVKTLHPKIHAGILARRDVAAHVNTVGSEGLIDLVVVNLYPFQEVSQHPDVRLDVALEHIDIGGVTLLRAAAKNFPHVAVVSDAAQYPKVVAAITEGQGSLSEELSRDLARAAFQLTSRYDRWITNFLAHVPDEQLLPDEVSVQARKHQGLRYGENPHQQAAWYVPLTGTLGGLAGLVQRQGKELSYNNFLDLDAAIRCLADFAQPTCVIVKHASPCGIASRPSMAEAYERAHACDPEAAFGGVVGMNRPLDAKAASQMLSTFLEVIVAPRIDSQARPLLAKKPSLRLLELEHAGTSASLEWRSLLGGWLIQEQDLATFDESALRTVTKRSPTDVEHRDLLFAWRAAKHVKSNAIVLAKAEATVGIGQGQPSRVRAVRLALQNASEHARGAALASDGFFPFPDSVELAAQAGVSAIIQPGGSVKDAQVIAAADKAGLAMVFTGVRHFRH